MRRSTQASWPQVAMQASRWILNRSALSAFLDRSVAAILAVLLSTTAFAETPDFCADMGRGPNGLPLFISPSGDEPSCPVTQAQPIASLKTALDSTSDAAFMEHLSGKVRGLALESEFQANLYLNCFSTPASSSLASSDEIRTALQPHCEKVRKEVGEATAKLPALRQHLALSAPRFRSDVEATNLPPKEKINPEVPLPQTGYENPLPIPYLLPNLKLKLQTKRLELRPLNSDETTQALKSYDSWIAEYKREHPPTDPITGMADGSSVRNANYQMGLKKFIEQKRREQQEEANKLLTSYPFLNHFDSADSSDKAVIAATERLKEKLKTLRDVIKDMKGNVLTAESVQFYFLFGGAVRDTVREHPELCGAANRLAARAAELEFNDTVKLAAGSLVIGSACSAVTRNPMGCFTGIGFIGAGYHWWEARNGYATRLIALDTAISEKTRLVDLVDDLEPAERDVFIGAAMIPAPYEAFAGKGWEAAYHASPLFRKAVDKMSRKAHISSNELLERISDHIKQKAAKP